MKRTIFMFAVVYLLSMSVWTFAGEATEADKLASFFATCTDRAGVTMEVSDFSYNFHYPSDFIQAHSGSDPDLKITFISFSEHPPTAMLETTVYLQVKNVGNAESPPGNLEVTLLVFSANGKPFQGNIIDLGEIESIGPGESIPLSFPYTFISHAYSECLEVKLHPEYDMDSNLANNTRQMDLVLYPNPYAYYNCIGELITIASAVLL